MKNLFLGLALVAVLCVSAQAGSVSVVESSVASGKAFAISVDDSGVADYNSVSVEIKPVGAAAFLNHNPTGANGATILDPGADATFINARLGFPVPFGGFGWSVPTAENAPTGLVFGAGPLGANIDVAAPIFLANVVLPEGESAIANIRLQAAGVDVASYLNVAIGGAVIPEPASLAMASIGLIGLVLRRRNG